MVQHKQFSSNVKNELNNTFKQNEIVTGKDTILYILRQDCGNYSLRIRISSFKV